MNPPFSLLVVVTSLAFLGGCRMNQKPAEIAVEESEERLVVRESGYLEPSVYNAGLGLHARSEGSFLVVSLHNERVDQLTVSPFDFAVITGDNPETDLVLVDARSVNLRATTPIVLEPESKKVMRLQFTSLPTLSGYRLVYNNPRNQIRFFVGIE